MGSCRCTGACRPPITTNHQNQEERLLSTSIAPCITVIEEAPEHAAETVADVAHHADQLRRNTTIPVVEEAPEHAAETVADVAHHADLGIVVVVVNEGEAVVLGVGLQQPARQADVIEAHPDLNRETREWVYVLYSIIAFNAVLRSRSRWSRNNFGTWSRNRNYILNKYICTAVSLVDVRMKRNYCNFYLH